MELHILSVQPWRRGVAQTARSQIEQRDADGAPVRRGGGVVGNEQARHAAEALECVCLAILS